MSSRDADRRVWELRVANRKRHVIADVRIEIDEPRLDELQHRGRSERLLHRRIHVDVIDAGVFAEGPGPDDPVLMDHRHLDRRCVAGGDHRRDLCVEFGLERGGAFGTGQRAGGGADDETQDE